MPIGNWNLQWLNHNSQRSYPLTEKATKTDTTGTIRIPDSFILALYFPVHVGMAVTPDRFFIRTLLISPIGYNVTIGYDDGAGEIVSVAAVNIAKSVHVPNRSYAIAGFDSFDDSVGQIVIGKLDEIEGLPPGLYEFTSAGGAIESDAIRPMIRGVTSLRVANGAELSDRLYGDITLVAGTNMRLGVNLGGEDGPEIVFNAISGLNLNENCVCQDPKEPECIRCINGVCSNDGQYTFSQGDCIEITPTVNGLIFTDTCAKPCCGCEELDALTTQVDRFSDGVQTLQNFVTRLSSEVTQMSLVVLGSRLGDAGCSRC